MSLLYIGVCVICLYIYIFFFFSSLLLFWFKRQREGDDVQQRATGRFESALACSTQWAIWCESVKRFEWVVRIEIYRFCPFTIQLLHLLTHSSVGGQQRKIATNKASTIHWDTCSTESDSFFPSPAYIKESRQWGMNDFSKGLNMERDKM